MKDKIEWVLLQETIKELFSGFEVRKFKDIVQKDGNGYNWYLSFHDLRNSDSITIHTKFIFKLTDDKKYLRKLEFLYLKNINCKYQIIKFDTLEELQEVILEILNNSMFGNDIVKLSEFIIEPERTINNYFYKNSIEDYTVFDFEYYPSNSILKCQDLIFEFNFNVNNSQEVRLVLSKENNTYKYVFKSGGKTFTITKNNLDSILDTIVLFITKHLS